MDTIWTVVVIVVLALANAWVAKMKKPGEDEPEEPIQPSGQRRSDGEVREEWERKIREMLGGEPQPPPPPPLPPAKPVPVPSVPQPAKIRPILIPTLEEPPPLPRSSILPQSEKTHHRASQLEEQVQAWMHQAAIRTASHKVSQKRPPVQAHPVTRMLKSPAHVRDAFVAGIVLAPPKSLASDLS